MKKKTKKKLPGEFIHWTDVENGDGGVAKMVAFSRNYQTVVAAVDDDSWTILPVGKGSCNYDIHGMIGDDPGYGGAAPECAHLLADLGFWSNNDADSFCRWYREESIKKSQNVIVKQAVDVLLKHGYSVSKPDGD